MIIQSFSLWIVLLGCLLKSYESFRGNRVVGNWSPRRKQFASSNQVSGRTPFTTSKEEISKNSDMGSGNSMINVFSQMEDPNMPIENEESSEPMNGEVVNSSSWVRDAIREIHTIIEYLLEVDRKYQHSLEEIKKASSLSSSIPSSKRSSQSVGAARPGGLQSINPQILLDKSEYLCKEGVYDAIMSYRFSECQKQIPSDDVSAGSNDSNDTSTIRTIARQELLSLKRVNSFLQGFIFSEKKSRARLKINYLLAGAEIGQVDTAVNRLAATKEIDQFLLSYLSQLISSEQMKLNAVLDSSPIATLYQNNSKADSSGEQTSSSTSDTNRVQLKEKERQLSLERIEETLQQLAEYSKTTSSTSPIQEEIEELTAKNKVLKILLLIERRLKAELKYSSSFEMKLLGELINLPFSEDRVNQMKKSLPSIEKMEIFEQFLESGIKYIQENGMIGKEDIQSKQMIQLSPEKLQIMKELLFDLQEIRKKLLSGYDNERTVFEVKSD